MNNVVDKYFEQYDAKDKTYALFDKLRDYPISLQIITIVFHCLNGWMV